jgi:hypothetical protein
MANPNPYGTAARPGQIANFGINQRQKTNLNDASGADLYNMFGFQQNQVNL